MHRIDTPSATAEHRFTEGSPTGGVPATVVSDDWLNDVQENVCQAIEGAGITLQKGDFTQLMQAIRTLAAGAVISNFDVSSTGGIDFAVNGGPSFKIRWAQFSLGAPMGAIQTVAWSTAFTTAVLFALTTPFNAAFDQIGVSALNLGNITVSKGTSDSLARTGFVIAGGY